VTTRSKQPLGLLLSNRRQRRVLRAIEAAAAELLRKFKSQNQDVLGQPGAAAFPKRIFVTPEGSAPLPDGRSLSYFEIVQEKWEQFSNNHEEEIKLEFTDATVSLLQQTVIDSHVLERRLMERIKESS
jgi:hypothetical protein